MLYLTGFQISEVTQVRTGESDANLLKTYHDKKTSINQTRWPEFMWLLYIDQQTLKLKLLKAVWIWVAYTHSWSMISLKALKGIQVWLCELKWLQEDMSIYIIRNCISCLSWHRYGVGWVDRLISYSLEAANFHAKYHLQLADVPSIWPISEKICDTKYSSQHFAVCLGTKTCPSGFFFFF